MSGEPRPSGGRPDRAPGRRGSHAAPRRWSRRRTLAWILAVLALLVVVVPVALLAARGPLERGRQEAMRGQEALLEGDLPLALTDIDQAVSSFRRARWILRNPLTMVAGVLPGTGSTLRTAGALAWAGELAGEGARSALEGVEALPGGMSALAPEGGRIPVERIAALEPAVAEAAARMAQARTLVADSPDLLAVGPVRNARRDGLRLLTDADEALATAAALTRVLPDFLGHDGPRTYFLGASNPAEQRGTGGFIGAWAILEAADGRLSFGEFEDIHALPRVPPRRAVAQPAADFGDRYDRYGSRYRWTTVNVSPDFRSAAEVVEGLYEESVGDDLDGVIVVDPFAIAALMEASGPVSVPGFGQVDAAGLVPLITNEAYARFESREDRQRILGVISGAVLQSFLRDGAGDPTAAVAALGVAAGRGHLLLHSVDPDEQAHLEAAGVAGALPEGPGDAFVLALNSQSNAKVDYYLDVDVDLDVSLQPGGAVATQAHVRLHNDAPTEGQPEYVIGPNMPDLSAGDNPLLVDVVCSSRCAFEGFSPQAASDRVRLGTDRGLAALGTQVRLPSGGEEEMTFAWRSEDAWTEAEGLLTYRLHVRGPATVRPPTLRVRLAIPPDVEVVEVSGAEVDTDGALVLGDAWRGDREITVTLARDTLDRLVAHVREILAKPLVRIGGEG